MCSCLIGCYEVSTKGSKVVEEKHPMLYLLNIYKFINQHESLTVCLKCICLQQYSILTYTICCVLIGALVVEGLQ